MFRLTYINLKATAGTISCADAGLELVHLCLQGADPVSLLLNQQNEAYESCKLTEHHHANNKF